MRLRAPNWLELAAGADIFTDTYIFVTAHRIVNICVCMYINTVYVFCECGKFVWRFAVIATPQVFARETAIWLMIIGLDFVHLFDDAWATREHGVLVKEPNRIEPGFNWKVQWANLWIWIAVVIGSWFLVSFGMQISLKRTPRIFRLICYDVYIDSRSTFGISKSGFFAFQDITNNKKGITWFPSLKPLKLAKYECNVICTRF